MEPPAGFHKNNKLKCHVSAGQLRAADLVDTQSTTLLRSSEQPVQGTVLLSFDTNLVFIQNTLQLYEKWTGNPVEYVA